MPRLIALLAAVALIAAGCGADDAPEEPVAWASCANDEDGWVAEHPPDWRVNPGGAVAPCSLFDPQPVEAPEGPGGIPLDIAVQLRSETPARGIAELLEDPLTEELDRRELTVDGRRAWRIAAEQAEEGTIPAGTRSVRYVVDLGDGRALIGASYGVGDPPLRRKAEVLDAMMRRISLVEPDPPQRAWEPLPAAPIERINHSATWSGERMLVWGGGEQVRDDGAAWDPAAREWRALPPAPIPARWAHHAAWSGEELLVWGGRAGPDHLAECFADGARYDPGTGAWATMAAAPGEGRCGSGAAWTGRELVVVGGHAAAGPPSRGDVRADAIAYDPAADAWRTLPPAPIGPRMDPVVAWSGREVLVVGGTDDDLEPRREGAALDPQTGEWRALPDMPLPARAGLAGAWAGGELVVLGGRDDVASRARGRTDAAALDPEEGRWRELPAMPGPHDDPALAWTGEELIVAGGVRGEEERPAVVSYDPAQDAWRARPAAPGGPRVSHTVVWTGEELILWGGRFRGGIAGAAWRPG